MSARISAFLVWAVVSATLLFWGLRLVVRSPPSPAQAVAVDDSSAVRGDLTRLLGAAPVPVVAAATAVPEANARFKLMGIMAPKSQVPASQGVALIAVDGKPPRAVKVGAYLDDQLVLQSVSLRTAAIGPAGGPSAVVLEMPQLPSAATGSLPPLNGGVPVPTGRFVPPSSLPGQGAPGQGMPGQGGSSQGMPTQGMPTQGASPQGLPPQSGAPTGGLPASVRGNPSSPNN